MIPPLFIMGLWPVVVFVFFSRQPPAKAMIWSVLAGYLLLPRTVGFSVPMMPLIDKDILPSLTAGIAAAYALSKAENKSSNQHILPGWMPRQTMAKLFVIFLAVGAAGTVMTNGNALIYGERIVVGLQAKHIAPLVFEVLLGVIPFILARRFLGHPDSHLLLLYAFAVSGLAYSFLTIYEVRFAPQINIKVYGFFQHSWLQHVRGDGFRPIVFLQHGLWLSLFLSTSILSCLVLFRSKVGAHPKRWLYGAAWLLIVLYMTKSLGAFVITLVLAPLILVMGKSKQLLISAIIASTVMTYPLLRGANLIPVDQVVEMAGNISAERADSLQTRLNNEDALLAKARQKPIFGWSTWAGRNRVYDDEGRDISLTDGFWVITIGSSGWVGYLAKFGLASGAIILLAFRHKRYNLDIATVGLCVVLVGNLIDLIPNATLTPLTWLMAGALFGRLEYSVITEQSDEDVPRTIGRKLGYSRFHRKSTSLEESLPSTRKTTLASPRHRRKREPVS